MAKHRKTNGKESHSLSQSDPKARKEVANSKELSKSGITPKVSNNQKISTWQARVSQKEEEVSGLLIQIQDLKNSLNMFLGEYYSYVGMHYIMLKGLKLTIGEYQVRINLFQNKQEDLESLYKADEPNYQEWQKNNRLKNEVHQLAEEYRRRIKKGENKPPLDSKSQQELKALFGKLARRFRPDMAKDDEQRREFREIFISVNEAYRNKDLETLKEYVKRAIPERVTDRETPRERLARLKEYHESILGIIPKLWAELRDLKASETYMLKEKVEQAKKRGENILKQLAANIEGEINKTRTEVDEIDACYKKMREV